MQAGTVLVAHGQAPEPGQPGEGVFHDPAVPPEPDAALDAVPCNAGLDAAGAALAAAAPVVAALVGMQLVRSTPWPPTVSGPNARHRVQRGCQHHAVVAVGAAQRDADRRSVPSIVPWASVTLEQPS